MKKVLPIFLLFLLFSGFAFGQTKEIDSLLNTINEKLEDSLKARAYARLAWLHIKVDAQKASQFLDTSETIYRSLKDEEGLLQIAYKRSVLNRYAGNYQEALEQINLFISQKEKAGDSLSVADALYQKAVIVQSTGDFATGIQLYYRALAIYEKDNDSLSIGNLHNSIGLIFKNSGQLDEAMKSYKMAEAIQLEIQANSDLCNTYNSIATVHAIKKNLDSALGFFNKSLKYSENTNSSFGIAMANQNIGHVLLEQKKYDESKLHLQKAYKIQKNNNYNEHLLSTLTTLSFLHNDLGELNKSKLYLEEAGALKLNFNVGNQQYHWAYHEYYESSKNFKESLNHYKKYTFLKDSIFKKENLSAINGLKIKYQSEKKDKEIAEQKLSITESKSKTRTMSILIVSLLLGSILLWFSFSQRQKRMQQQLVSIEREQEVRTLESLMEGEEKERLRIAKELHDGVNGDLAAIKFKLTSLLETNNKVINEAVAMIDTSSEQVRAISHNLVPPSLRDFNLLEAVSTYCENMNAIHDPEISFQHLGNDIVLDKKQEANLFRVVQELVANSIKHAEAKEIIVQLSNVEDNLQLTVEDDGRGFDVNNIESDGIGMQNIKSRVEYLNGIMDIKSDKKGSSFTITIADKSEKS